LDSLGRFDLSWKNSLCFFLRLASLSLLSTGWAWTLFWWSAK